MKRIFLGLMIFANAASCCKKAFAQEVSVLPFELVQMNHETTGTTYKTTDHPNGVFVLEFFANFCGPCNSNAAAVDTLAEEYIDEPRVQVLDVGLDTRVTEYTRWIERHEPNHPVLNAGDKVLWRKLGYRYIPQAVVVDCKGEVRYAPPAGTWSATVKQKIRETVDTLLTESCEEGSQPLPISGTNWKVVLGTGDNSINAFDNARRDVKGTVLERGVSDENIKELSMNPSEGVTAMTKVNLEKSFTELSPKEGDGCFLFLTSHGSRRGFYLRGQGTLLPSELDGILDRTCGTLPTVILMSACYSGRFLEDGMQQPNRIILTAARKDRTSFGCQAEAEYTYWDGCLLDDLGTATTWEDLYSKTKACVTRKEAGIFRPSLPQAYFGMTDVGVLE